MDRIERIRERAYQIWMSEGQPLGRDGEHWERARLQIEKELKNGAAAHQAGVNDVPAAAVHKGPSSSSPTPGFEPADGLNTPGVKPRQ